ncbi:methyltransferase domain-containing protein [Rheinheimera sp. D18]|uniref:class I SAM-dependent methyltransferase n=1 Tax=Rheinheimera sp. D18 TaxID=2545632 RepID=UPI0010452984|nr:class I SAM-dependent methyltransferase [Rheinheimera sp. D18]QBL09891.1 methyltransferase domain-containing protein [Rheinheimera sp. D18]
MKCRHCQHDLILPLVDLGVMPPSNAYLSSPDQFALEKVYPLKVWVCQHCWLVQTEDFTKADELFTADYAYFSSTSISWLAHAKQFAENSIRDLELNTQSFVVEIASNDGYMLKNYLAAGIPCLGVEPTDATATAARALGIDVVSEFFGQTLATTLVSDYRKADLIIANNVLAHVPDINDFVAGIALLLAEQGTASVEFPHLLNLLALSQFDTIYHEHYSYLSLHSACHIFSGIGLKVYNVEKLPTHGGSLRLWLCHQHAQRATNKAVAEVLAEEDAAGLRSVDAYTGFQVKVDAIAERLRQFLQQCAQQDRKVVAYGAAAKGNTLLNYASVTRFWLPVVADAALSKQGKYLPGSHIPIVAPDSLADLQPDYVLVLPWNIRHEIVSQLQQVLRNTTQYVTLIPELYVS